MDLKLKHNIVTSKEEIERFAQRSKTEYRTSADPSSELELIVPIVDWPILTYLIQLVLLTPDLSQAVENAQNTANTKPQIRFEFSKEYSDEEKAKKYKAAKREIDELNRTMYPGSNLKGLINDLVFSNRTSGCMVAEWVPKADLSGIERVVIVPSLTARWFKNRRTNRIVLKQKVPTYTGMSNDLKKTYITLNPRTTLYRAGKRAEGNPYGIPPYLSVIDKVEAQKEFYDKLKKILENQSLMGILKVLWRQPPKKNASESDASYQTRVRALLDSKVTSFKDAFKDGMATGFQKDVEIDHLQTTKGGFDIYKVFQLIEEQVFSAINQDPALGGRTYSTTETYAGVVYDKFLNGLNSVQNDVADILALGYKLHLQMKGFDVTNVNVTLAKAKSLTTKTDAEARFMEQKVNHELYSDGIIDQDQYANNMDYDTPDKPEPRYPYASDVEAQSAADSNISIKENKNGERQTRGDKEKGVTKEEPRQNR